MDAKFEELYAKGKSYNWYAGDVPVLTTARRPKLRKGRMMNGYEIKELVELREAMASEKVARADYYQGQTWLEKSGVGGAENANASLDLAQVRSVQIWWDWVSVVYLDGRHEKRHDLDRHGLEAEVKALGWSDPLNYNYFMSPQRVEVTA